MPKKHYSKNQNKANQDDCKQNKIILHASKELKPIQRVLKIKPDGKSVAIPRLHFNDSLTNEAVKISTNKMEKLSLYETVNYTSEKGIRKNFKVIKVGSKNKPNLKFPKHITPLEFPLPEENPKINIDVNAQNNANDIIFDNESESRIRKTSENKSVPMDPTKILPAAVKRPILQSTSSTVSSVRVGYDSVYVPQIKGFVDPNDLSYISDEKYPRSKPILAKLITLYNYGRYIRGVPHQYVEDAKRPIKFLDFPKKRPKRKPSILGTILTIDLGNSNNHENIFIPTQPSEITNIERFKFDTPPPDH